MRPFPRLLSITILTLCVAVSAFALVRALLRPVPGEAAAVALRVATLWSASLATALATIALVIELRAHAPRERPFAFLRGLFCTAVAVWIGFLLFAQPYHRLRLELAVTIGLGAFALLWIAVPLQARVPRTLGRVVDVALFNLCLALLVAELGLRAIACVRPSPLFARVGGTPMELLEDQRQAAGKRRYLFPCNGGGYYDEEFVRRKMGEHLIVTIGDSFSFGVVPHACHFTTVCEGRLGFPVDNMGVPGIGPPEYAYLLEHEALELDPELVVIDVFVGNDLVFPREVTPTLDPILRSWFDRRNALVWLVPDRLWRIAREKHSRGDDHRSPVGTPQGELATPEDTPGETVEEQFPWVVDPWHEQPTFSEKTFVQIERLRADGICRSNSQPLDAVEECLSSMKRVCGTTPLAVMLIPDQLQVDDDVWRTVDAAAPGELERDRAQRILVPWLADHGIPCLDLLPILRAAPPLADGRRHVYHARDTHFNTRGNRIAGEALAEFVRGNWPDLAAK